MAEGGGLLNRYTLLKAYRGFESLRLRHPPTGGMAADLCVDADRVGAEHLGLPPFPQ